MLAPAVLLVSALVLAGCAAAPAAESARPLPAPRAAAPAPVAEPPATARADVVVGTPKRAPAVVDCFAHLAAIAEITDTPAEVQESESTAELCRYRLPHDRVTTTVSVYFTAEASGTPSHTRIGPLFGNTAHQVGRGDRGSCGLSVAIDPALAAHRHGSSLTVLGSYPAAPCAVNRKIFDAVFARLPAG